MANKLTHIDAENGNAQMVDISDKTITSRIAIAHGKLYMQPSTLVLIRENNIKKGDVLAIARIAGIMAAKNTANIIPLCHQIPLSSVKIDFEFSDIEENSMLSIIAQAKTQAATGVEMEALTAVSTAALTIYDMCKAVDKGIIISDIALNYKDGGKSGKYDAQQR